MADPVTPPPQAPEPAHAPDTAVVNLPVPDDLVPMGYVAGAFGVRGQVKVQAETEYADSLLDFPIWWLGQPGNWRAYGVQEGAAASKHLHVTLQGIASREAAHALRGCTVAVSRAAFPEPETDAYYWADLMGMAVVNRSGETLGVVDHLLDTGAHAVLVVRDGAQERLIPFVAAVVDAVDAAQRRITVDWGLDY